MEMRKSIDQVVAELNTQYKAKGVTFEVTAPGPNAAGLIGDDYFNLKTTLSLHVA